MAISAEEVFNGVKDAIVESLNVEENKVVPMALLTEDLGAESIDFLDIAFRLENKFGIKVPRGDLLPEPHFAERPEFVRNHEITSEGLAELKKLFPYADFSALEKHPHMDNVPRIYTVDTLCRYVEAKLKQASTTP